MPKGDGVTPDQFGVVYDQNGKIVGFKSSTPAAGANAVKVYMGQTGNNDVPAMDRGKAGNSIDSTLTQDAAYASYYSWAPSEQQSFANKLYRSGIISSPNDFQSAVAYWKQAVDYAGTQYTIGGKKLTPWDVVQQSLGLAKAAGAAQPRQPTTVTSTATQVLTNGDANAMINAMYQNELGRDPTDGERSRYRSMLINKSKDSPTVTTTKRQFLTNPDGTQGAQTGGGSSVTTGGFSSAEGNDMLQQDVHADPEYGAYQAATSYMQAIESLFSGPNLTGG